MFPVSQAAAGTLMRGVKGGLVKGFTHNSFAFQKSQNKIIVIIDLWFQPPVCSYEFPREASCRWTWVHWSSYIKRLKNVLCSEWLASQAGKMSSCIVLVCFGYSESRAEEKKYCRPNIELRLLFISCHPPLSENLKQPSFVQEQSILFWLHNKSLFSKVFGQNGWI